MKAVISISVIMLVFISADAQKRYSPMKIRADLDSLTFYLESAHPNPYYRYSKMEFHQAIDSAKLSVRQSLTYVDFYLMAQKLLAKLQDGHIDLEMPLDSLNNQKYLPFQYKVALNPKKPFILLRQNVVAGTQILKENTEVLSINGIRAHKIVDDVVSLVTGESVNFRASYGSKHFDFYMGNLYPKKKSYEVTYLYKGKVKTTILKGENQTGFDKNHDIKPTKKLAKRSSSLDFLNANTALMTLKDFENLDGFKIFTDSAFNAIARSEIKNLIIDLRENLGGDSGVGDYLLQYLLHAPFRQYDRIYEKNSKLLKDRLMAHRIGKSLSHSDSTLLSKPNGSIDTIQNGNDSLLDLKSRFHGNVYVLISAITFSSAADFAQAFAYYKRGAIIGEESGGLILSYGDIVPAILPNTKLPLVVSSKLYLNIGAKENDWHGVIPNIPCKSENALKKAMFIIR